MSNIGDGQRTGYGLTKLRERYIRRAEHLTQDRAFRSEIEKRRSDWNMRFPRYALGIGTPLAPSLKPSTLEDDTVAEVRERRRPGSLYGRPSEIPAERDDHYSIFDQAVERIQRWFPDMLEADRHWHDVTLELAEAFFLRMTFIRSIIAIILGSASSLSASIPTHDLSTTVRIYSRRLRWKSATHCCPRAHRTPVSIYRSIPA